MNVSHNGETEQRGREQSVFAAQQAKTGGFHFSHFMFYILNRTLLYLFFNGGLGLLVKHQESMCNLCVLYVCLCYMLEREREPVQGGVEGLGGLRQMGQRGGG